MKTNRKTEIWIKIMKAGEICGCHQRADRSFFVKGWQFPLCARCTGVVLGQICGFPAAVVLNIPLSAAAICCEATLADWSVQQAGIKQSTNLRRLITGFAGGFGLAVFYTAAVKKLITNISGGKNVSENSKTCFQTAVQ